MRICVIIPNYNGEAWLGPCLDSLAAQSRPPESVIVVDNGSADRSRELARAHPVAPVVIELEANMGFAAAVNRGIARADADAVALLNNDAVADADWLRAGAAAMEKYPQVSMFASLMLGAQDRGRVDSAGDLYPRDGRPRPRGHGEPADRFAAEAEVFSACAGAAFFRKALLDELGGFEESFFAYLEDVDLGFRARARGHCCVFVPAARVYHRGAATDLSDRAGKKPVDSAERVFLIARNRLRLVARNWPASWIVRFSPRLGLGLTRSAAYHLFVSRQGGAFFRGIMAGASSFAADRATAPAGSGAAYDDIVRLMREGSRPWPR